MHTPYWDARLNHNDMNTEYQIVFYDSRLEDVEEFIDEGGYGQNVYRIDDNYGDIVVETKTMDEDDFWQMYDYLYETWGDRVDFNPY